VLDDANFNEKVMNSEDIWMVEFYAPWCGHCKNLEPHWNKLAFHMKGKKIRIAKFDADKNKSVGSRYII
jgi:protein disulfide-isomerase A6